MAYGDKPKWVAKSRNAVQTQYLARLSAGAALLEQLVSLSSAHAKHLKSELEAGRDALGLFLPAKPEPVVAAPEKPKKPRRHVPRLYAPQMLVLGQRAAELLMSIAPLIESVSNTLIERGVDIRPYLRKPGLLKKMGINMPDLEQASLVELEEALEKISAWIAEAQADDDPPREAMPRAEPAAASAKPPEIEKPAAIQPEKSIEQMKAELDFYLESFQSRSGSKK